MTASMVELITNSSRTWMDNALEFRILAKQGIDIRLGVLVACSVQERLGTGVTKEQTLSRTTLAKGSATAFAKESETSTQRIQRHLHAWDECAKEGLCDPSSTLAPYRATDPNLRVPPAEKFIEFFDASRSGGRPRASVKEIAARAATDPTYKKTLMTAIEAEEIRSEVEELKKQETESKNGEPTETTNEDTKALAELVAKKNAVSKWLSLIHVAATKTKAALDTLEKISPDITDAQISEAVSSLIDAEGDVGILRSRLVTLIAERGGSNG